MQERVHLLKVDPCPKHGSNASRGDRKTASLQPEWLGFDEAMHFIMLISLAACVPFCVCDALHWFATR